MRYACVNLLLALLLLGAALPASAQPAGPGDTRLIQVSVLLAAKSGPDALAELPANVRKAVEDIRGFLPYRSYSMLDAGLVRTNQEGRTTLRGPGGRDLIITFHLRPISSSERLLVQSFRVQEAPAPLPPRAPGGGADPAPALAPSAARALVTTSFEAEVGQTVVVGSSRINGGDEALIVLFTALP